MAAALRAPSVGKRWSSAKPGSANQMSQPFKLDQFLANVADFDLDSVLDSAQSQESATVGQQTVDQATDQTAAQGNEQDQDTDTTTVTDGGDGGNGGNAVAG